MTMEAGGKVTREKTRIYVGGLGGGVTEDDLRKTFSALGEVVAVDVVRTKGRSFAYLDFIPSSDKSLPKLFSTYNGCMWKGGKLRLEKAKEHYLLRLRREWQEDAEHASKASNCHADPSESHDTSEKPKKPSSDKMQLRIFFPKLQKVKSLASVGIGKHKYSFQRIQVPSVPNHFCDCEEHSRPFLTTDEKHSSEFENASSGINEQELNIMNSVMNKIFERENPTKPTIEKSKLMNGRGISINSNDELLVNENEEDHLTDEDNLITNVVSGKSDSMDLLGEMKTIMANQEPVAYRLRTSSDKKPKNAHDGQKKKIAPLRKKRESPHLEENDSDDTVIPETAKNSQTHSNTQVSSKKELESGTKKLGSYSLWPQKSTWKDLIGQKGNTPFSISDIISTVPQEKEMEAKTDDLDLLVTKNAHNTRNKKSLLRNKKRKSDSGNNEMVYSGREQTKSEQPINYQEDTAKVDSVTEEISIQDIVPNVSQQKGEEPRTDDLDIPLTTTTHQFSKSDFLPSAALQKEGEPRTDDLDMPLTTKHQFSVSDVLPSASQQKEEEPLSDDLGVETKNLDKRGNADSQLGNSKDLEKTTEAPPEKHDEDLIRTARGESWRHKSSWTQLISNTGNGSFSISQVVPNLSFEKHQPQGSADNVDVQPAKQNLDTAPASIVVSEANNDHTPAVMVTERTFSEKEVRPSSSVNNTLERKRILSLGNLESDDTCPFMRTEASMKEWKKAKAALSGSLNKKKRSVKESV